MTDLMDSDCFKIYLVRIYPVARVKVKLVIGIERHRRRAAKTLLPPIRVGYRIEQAQSTGVSRWSCHGSGVADISRDRTDRQRVVDGELLLVRCRRNQLRLYRL